MARTGGFEPPFSAPFTDHRFVAGVGYVRIFGRGSGPRSRVTTLRGSYPVQLDDAPMAPVPGIEPGYSLLNRQRLAPCLALTGKLVENRGNAPRTACLQGAPEPLLVPHGAEGWS